MSTQTEPTDPIAEAGPTEEELLVAAAARHSTRELLEEVIDTEARIAALADHAGTLRSVLLQRGREYVDTEGMVPTWRSPIGSVVYTAPTDKAAVADPAAFAAWAAARVPDEVLATLRVPTQQLEAAVAALDGAGIAADVTLEVREVWTKAFLKALALVDGEVFAPDTGEAVAGVRVVPGGAPTVSVRPDKQHKARTIAEVRAATLAALPPSAGGSLAGVVPAATPTPTPAPVEDLQAAPVDVTGGHVCQVLSVPVEDEDAEGEPDYGTPTAIDADVQARWVAGTVDLEVLAVRPIHRLRELALELGVVDKLPRRKAELVDLITARVEELTR